MTETTDMSEAIETANNVVKDLQKFGYDYSAHVNAIAELFENYLWHGNWEMSTSFEDGTPNLNFIQEDEYDQHRDNSRESIITSSQGHYVQIEGVNYNMEMMENAKSFKK